MATFKAYRNGATMGRGNPNPVGGKRNRIVGWSPSSVRRHKRWLYSIESGDLVGEGDAITLTLRDCPDTQHEWSHMLQLLFGRLRADGYYRWHWVVEWQRRGTPHLHLAVYGKESPGRKVIDHWLDIASPYRPELMGQHFTPITGPVGWLKYLSKHASRGVKHYQRHGKPAGWETTGRLWGYGGEWPIFEADQGFLTMPQFWRVRRMVRSWAVADARARGDFRGVAYLRRMLKCNSRELSTVRGISEWVSGPVFLAMAFCAGWSGELSPATD